MELERRKEEVLKKIVSEYIHTGQPVGSERIVEKFHLPISSATIRNEMAELEKLGYIQHPYTSAGRIPTSKGYRFFVEDMLKDKKPIDIGKIKLPEPEKIQNLHDVLSEVSDLISLHTNEISLVVSPCIEEVTINYIHFFIVLPDSLYMVVITNTQTSEAALLGNFSLSKEDLIRIENLLNSELASLTLKEASDKIEKKRFYKSELNRYSQIIGTLYLYMKNELTKGVTHDIYIKGISNLLTTRISLAEQKVKFLLNIFEEKKLLSEIIESVPSSGSIGLSIGEENKFPELWDYSLISVKYTIKEMEGTLALLGPVRMDYIKGIYVLECIADKLEEIAEKIIE
jgi:heat-inducible transcriptional repressor